MQLNPNHIKAIEKLIQKKDQQDFIDRAIELALKEAQKKSSLNKKKEEGALKIFIDGGSRGNPGPAGGGFVVYKAGDLILEGSEFFGRQTNNQAEYLALRSALRKVYESYGDVAIACFMDSQLVVEQMKGNYKVKSPNVKPLHQEVSRIAEQFSHFEISHVPREQNKEADRLANEAMDKNH